MTVIRPALANANEIITWALVLVLGPGLVFAGSPAATQAAAEASAPSPNGFDAGRMAERLNSPDFAVRQQATFELLDGGAKAVPIMRRIMSAHPAPEVEMRIRMTAELLFAQVAVPPGEQQGFLGIQMANYEVPNEARAGGVEITKVLPFMPAERAGLKEGDHILAIDGTDLNKQGYRTMRKLLSGPVGSKAKLAISHNGSLKRLEVERLPLINLATGVE